MTQQAHLSDAFPWPTAWPSPAWATAPGGCRTGRRPWPPSRPPSPWATATLTPPPTTATRPAWARPSGPAACPGGGLPHQQGLEHRPGLCPNQGRLPGHPGPPGHRLPGPLPHPLARRRQPVRRLGGHQPGHLAGHDGALPGGEDPGHRRVQLPPPHHLKALLETEVAPMVNQIEFHPGRQRGRPWPSAGTTASWWRPGAPWAGAGCWTTPTPHRHRPKPRQDAGPNLPAVVPGTGVLPLPKSVTPARMAENRDLFTFALTPGDMAQIAALPPFGGSGHDPDQLDF